jgi:hypothetical protein
MGKEYKFVKPREGLTVRDPVNKAIIPAEGCNVPWIGPDGRYWRRRVNCGDVILIEVEEKPVQVSSNNFMKSGGR